MISFSAFGLPSFGFLAPAALGLLLGLPLIWLVIRVIPPAARKLVFPPAHILADLPKTTETPRSAPPWLALLRALGMALLIIGFAGPVLNPSKSVDTRALLIVVDDSWTSAPSWQDMMREAVEVARNAGGPVRVLFTAPGQPQTGDSEVKTARQAAALLAAAQPKALLPDYRNALNRVATLPKGMRIVWFSDGINHPGLAAFAATLADRGVVKVRTADVGAVAISRVETTSQGYSIGLLGGPKSKGTTRLEALNARGTVVSARDLDVRSFGVTFSLESARAPDVASLRVGDVRSAGGSYLLDAFDRRVRAGLVAERQEDQALLSDAYYLEQALKPYSDLTRGSIEQLTQSGLDVLLLPDASTLPERDVQALSRFVERGGILVRFAGPKLISAEPNTLLPAALAPQPRALRGALAWDNAGKVQPFARNSPFAGLPVPADARVNQIVVFAPDTAGNQVQPPRIWAQLSDGVALVTAKPMGRGQVVLFHTTAGPAWSDVAFSGLQVSMLRRVLARAATNALPASTVAPTVALKPVLILDGFGNIRPPDQSTQAIAPSQVTSVRPSAVHPPGIYEGGGARLIVQAVPSGLQLQPLPALPGLERVAKFSAGPKDIAPLFLVLGALILIGDALIALFFAGNAFSNPHSDDRTRSIAWPWSKKMLAAGLIFGLASSGLQSQPAFAQPARAAPKASAKSSTAPFLGDVSLAYIQTGDARTDASARAGLEGLSRALSMRTSVEPGAVIGVDPAQDDLALFPMLYWLLPDRVMETPPESARALDRYMKAGGVIFVDTRGAGRAPDVARNLTKTALRGLEAPPLERVPDGHVLGKSFYLLRGFPGRYPAAQLWVETAASANISANDGVSPLILGDGDWAAAWAGVRAGVPDATTSIASRDREMAVRVGINVVIYALTGNYKADQVHVPALLDRLGPPRAPNDTGRPR